SRDCGEPIHHSDRGVQYCAEEYVQVLKGAGISISMSRADNPYDNAMPEGFMRTLKCRGSVSDAVPQHRRCARTDRRGSGGLLQSETAAFGAGLPHARRV